MSETRKYTVDEDQAGRLDKFLSAHLTDYSRSQIQNYIKDGYVLVNAEAAKKTGLQLYGGDRVEINIPPIKMTNLIPENIPLDIIFENQDLLVINKPAGMVVHPSAGHSDGTLVHAVLSHAPDIIGIGGEKRPGVVHRLDKDTSGLILLAKNDHAHRWLQEQFKSRKVDKRYLALVDGAPPTPVGRIEAAIGRDPSHRKKMAIVSEAKGKAATSEYKTVESFPKHTLLEVHLLTGRTHQIRLHLSFLNCPIVGDPVYGHRHPSLPIKRQFLHAAKLEIALPGEDRPRKFEAPLPDDLRSVLEDLRR